MECKEAEKLVRDYIDNRIPPKKLSEFIEHINHCSSCYDELETYYTIHFAMKYLDEDRHISYNIQDMLRVELKRKAQYAKRFIRRRITSICTIIVLTIILIFTIIFLLIPDDTNEVWGVFSNVFALFKA